MEATPAGARITLPHLHTRADIIVATVSGAVATWIAVWLRGLADDPAGSLLWMTVLGGIGLVFGFVALSELYGILGRRVIEGRSDRLLLGRRLGARVVLPRAIPLSAIESVARGFESTETGDPETVRVRAGDDVHRLGAYLDPAALEWLEEAVRRMTATPT